MRVRFVFFGVPSSSHICTIVDHVMLLSTGKYVSTVTEFGCLPVSTLFHTERTGWILTRLVCIYLAKGYNTFGT